MLPTVPRPTTLCIRSCRVDHEDVPSSQGLAAQGLAHRDQRELGRASWNTVGLATIYRQHGVQVQLSVRRGREAVEFYRAAFGAEEVHRFGGTDDHEDVVCQLSLNGASFWVEDESPPDGNFSPETLGGCTERLLLIVDDPRGVVQRAVSLGASVVSPVGEEHGWLLGRIDDPFGHRWEIGHPLGAWPPRRRDEPS